MKLLLARHGNTFEAQETPYIVGRNEDLLLTATGEAQAAKLAMLLRREALVPYMVHCGKLQRTHRTAAIITQTLSLSEAIIDDRLTELDYGTWAGLTTDQARQRFGAAEVDAWDKDGIMPTDRHWHPAAAEIASSINSFAADSLASGQDIALAVTSNGVLRFFARLVNGLFERLAKEGQLKVSTGNLCCLKYEAKNWQLEFWNRKPNSSGP